MEDEEIMRNVLVDEIKCEEWMTEVVEDAHEEDDVERLIQRPDVPDGELAKFDIQAFNLGGEAGLGEVMVVGINAENTGCATPL